jgi:hypothetical protein
MTEKASNLCEIRLAIGSRARLGDAFDTVAGARSIDPTVPLAGGTPLLRSSQAAACMLAAGDSGHATPQELAAASGGSGPGPAFSGSVVAAPSIS